MTPNTASSADQELVQLAPASSTPSPSPSTTNNTSGQRQKRRPSDYASTISRHSTRTGHDNFYSGIHYRTLARFLTPSTLGQSYVASSPHHFEKRDHDFAVLQDLAYPRSDPRSLVPFKMLNLWRPLRGPLLDWPLAVCDLRSVGSEDLVKMDEVHRTAVLESHAIQYNKRQKWCFMSEMRTDEILIFKSADSEVQGAVPHGSFQDPRYPDAEPRESMELRVLVVY